MCREREREYELPLMEKMERESESVDGWMARAKESMSVWMGG